MFLDSDVQTRLYQVLRAYVEEWGAENVFVSVPKQWRDHCSGDLGPVRLNFSSDSAVSITVDYDYVRLVYCVHLDDQPRLLEIL